MSRRRPPAAVDAPRQRQLVTRVRLSSVAAAKHHRHRRKRTASRRPCSRCRAPPPPFARAKRLPSPSRDAPRSNRASIAFDVTPADSNALRRTTPSSVAAPPANRRQDATIPSIRVLIRFCHIPFTKHAYTAVRFIKQPGRCRATPRPSSHATSRLNRSPRYVRCQQYAEIMQRRKISVKRPAIYGTR